MMLEYVLTVWSIRLSLLLFALVVFLRLCEFMCLCERGGTAHSGGTWRSVRAAWVAGCLFAVLHVVAVFAYVMDWNHQAAVNDTARKTQQLIGVSFGGGVYFNYAFLLVWVFDAGWWCVWPAYYRRRAWLWDVSLIGYLWFIAFNATVIFESGITRWLGLLVTLAMVLTCGGVWLARKR